MEDEKTVAPTATIDTGGWIQALHTNTRLGTEKFPRGAFVKLTGARAKTLKTVPPGNFKTHKTIDAELKKRLAADGKIFE